MIMENAEFLRSKDYSIENENPTKCQRFIRKKYKCMILYILLCISLLEVIKLLISYLDETTIRQLLDKLISNKTNVP